MLPEATQPGKHARPSRTAWVATPTLRLRSGGRAQLGESDGTTSSATVRIVASYARAWCPQNTRSPPARRTRTLPCAPQRSHRSAAEGGSGFVGVSVGVTALPPSRLRRLSCYAGTTPTCHLSFPVGHGANVTVPYHLHRTCRAGLRFTRVGVQYGRIRPAGVRRSRSAGGGRFGFLILIWRMRSPFAMSPRRYVPGRRLLP